MTGSKQGFFARLGLARRRTRSPALGARELAVMDLLWQRNRQSAQEILASMGSEEIGLSTVQSTLERLHRKGLVVREKRARAFIYAAAWSRQDIISSLLHDITREVAGGDINPVISGFVSFLGNDEQHTATTINRLLDEKIKGADNE